MGASDGLCKNSRGNGRAENPNMWKIPGVSKSVSTAWFMANRCAREQQAREFDALRYYSAIDEEEWKEAAARARMEGRDPPQHWRLKRSRSFGDVHDIDEKKFLQLKRRHSDLAIEVTNVLREERVLLEAVVTLQAFLRGYLVRKTG